MMMLPAAAASLEALADAPCLMAPKGTVVELFDAPEAKIKQLKLKQRRIFTTKWSGADHTVSTEAKIEILDGKALAARRFTSFTRPVSREEIAGVAQKLRDHVEATNRTKRVENTVVSAVSQTPIDVEDVDALGWKKDIMPARKQHTTHLVATIFTNLND